MRCVWGNAIMQQSQIKVRSGIKWIWEVVFSLHPNARCALTFTSISQDLRLFTARSDGLYVHKFSDHMRSE